MKLHIVLLSLTLNLADYGYQDGVAADYANESFRSLQSGYAEGSPLVDYSIDVQTYTMADDVWTIRLEMAMNASDSEAAQAWLHKTVRGFIDTQGDEKILTSYWLRGVGEYETESLENYEEGEFLGWAPTGIYAEKEVVLSKYRQVALRENKAEFEELAVMLGLNADTAEAYDHYATAYADEKVAALLK
jgi:hypothetical protein